MGAKTFWDLGVVKESVNRKGMITSKPENGYWTVRLRSGDEYRALDSPSVRLSLKEKPKIIGIFADYEEGTVSFFNVETKSHIYTFTGCLFSERIFPFFPRTPLPLYAAAPIHSSSAPGSCTWTGGGPAGLLHPCVRDGDRRGDV